MKGLMAGVRSVASGGPFLVGGTGWHLGYGLRLWQDGVRWDITKLHWYSQNDGSSTAVPDTIYLGTKHFNILEFFKTNYGKPIARTECNAGPV